MKILARALAVFALLLCAHPRPATLSQAEAADASPAPLPPPPSLAPTERNLVAAHWAPTLFQETRDHRDLLTAFDFDGDWNGANNAAHLGLYPLRAVLYFTVAETTTHWLVTYVTYHPVDAKSFSGHDHDSEHITMVVRRDGSPWGRLEAMETRFHKSLYQYAAEGVDVHDGADDIDGLVHLGPDGRPIVYVQRVGHGLCGGQSPIALFDTLALSCRHRETPHIAQRGVVYRYTGHAEVPRSLDDRDVGYALVEIGDTLWAHAHERGPHATFASFMDFQGERCLLFECPRSVGRLFTAGPERLSTGMPWEEGGGRGTHRIGEAFFDPALALSRRLKFAVPFSTGYVHNPYLGIGHFGTAPDGALAQGSAERPVVASQAAPASARAVTPLGAMASPASAQMD